jgi:acyl-CoA thioesterase YciA
MSEIKEIEFATKPDGELVIKTLAMPSDTNANGDIFGGWVLSQMDLGAGILAKSYSPSGRAATVAIDGLSFINPIAVGEIVSCYAKMEKVGNTSMKIAIETWVYNYSSNESKIVTKAIFTFVAIDERGRPIRVKKL